MTEAEGHLKLKKTIYKILKESEFKKSSMEVLFELPQTVGNLSTDVVAMEDDVLFIFQCKDRKNIGDPEKEFSSTVARVDAILKGKTVRITSQNDPFVLEDLKRIKKIKTCYVFTERLENPDLENLARKYGLEFWNYKAVLYYKKTSNTLGKYSKYQIFREFAIPFESPIGTWEEHAIEISQEGNPTMYLLGIHPAILLEIGYVYRRGSGKSQAYQRILNKDRLLQISNFLNTPNSLLANPVIIVFDPDEKIQSKLHYRSNEYVLEFPRTYCCAWIIDGQHRIFGFKDHPKYSKWAKETNNDFKIPVVIFTKLPEPIQSKTFVEINYYQKRIDSSLFADLSTVMQDLRYPITWPNLLVQELNKTEPWKNLIKISELDTGKPISNNAFANMKLLDTLLGYKKKSKDPNPYVGVLYEMAPFDTRLEFANPKNQASFTKQVSVLKYFFQIIRDYVKDNNMENDRWLNHDRYGLTSRESVNALFLVLDRILKYDNNLKNWPKYISSIDAVNYEKSKLLKHGRGFPAYSSIANTIIGRINRDHKIKLRKIEKRKNRS